jgi:hypothetical protein
MEAIIAVSAFCCIVIVMVLLLVYVVVSRKRKAARLYKAATMEESRGNYTEAITLYELYLKEISGSAEEAENIQNRIKTLRALSAA